MLALHPSGRESEATLILTYCALVLACLTLLLAGDWHVGERSEGPGVFPEQWGAGWGQICLLLWLGIPCRNWGLGSGQSLCVLPSD